MLVTGPDAGAQPRVKVFDAATGREKFSFLAYTGSFRGGVRVAVGDVSGDGVTDIITGPGSGGGSLVKVFDGRNGNQLAGPVGGFQAYSTGQTDGLYVAAGDINADGYADIITGTERGSAPLIKVFSGRDGTVMASFTAEAIGSTGGVRVAAGDVNGDGRSDIIAAAGPGGLPRVCVFDGANRAELYNFFAFDTTFRGGVYVGAGDLNDDGKADIITGAGAGTGASPWVRIFSGANSAPMGNFQAYDAGFAGGVRVAAVDANADGKLDIATAAGPNGNQVRLFEGRTLRRLSAFYPYGTAFDNGIFVGGDARSSGGVSLLSSDPVVTVQATQPDILEGSSTPGVFTFTRTGDTSSDLPISFSLGGTSTSGLGGDYAFAITDYYIPAGSASTTVNIPPNDDTIFEPIETIVACVQPGFGYTVGTPGCATISITDDDAPPPTIPEEDCGCGGDGEVIDTAFTVRGNVSSGFSTDGGVRYLDGTVRVTGNDLGSGGFGVAWGLDRSWTNAAGYGAVTDWGNGTVVCELPYLGQDSAGTVEVLTNGTTARFFDQSGGNYTARFFFKEQLTYNAGTGEFTLTDTAGNKLLFHDFDINLPVDQRGKFKSFTDPKGNVLSVISRNAEGKPTEVQRTSTIGGTTTTESFVYAYLTSGNNAGRVSNATLRRQINAGAWTTVRQVDYTYYDLGQSFGNLGDLKTAVIKDAAGAVLDTTYHRYYTSGDPNGYQGGLKYVFNPQSYSRLKAAFADPFTATDAQAAPYADLYLQYDAVKRVKQQVVQGEGCSAALEARAHSHSATRPASSRTATTPGGGRRSRLCPMATRTSSTPTTPVR